MTRNSAVVLATHVKDLGCCLLIATSLMQTTTITIHLDQGNLAYPKALSWLQCALNFIISTTTCLYQDSHYTTWCIHADSYPCIARTAYQSRRVLGKKKRAAALAEIWFFLVQLCIEIVKQAVNGAQVSRGTLTFDTIPLYTVASEHVEDSLWKLHRIWVCDTPE